MTDPIAVSTTASMIAAKIECASYLADDHPTVQLLARFEAETRKEERERCAKVADDVADGSRVLHNLASKDHDRDGCNVHAEGWRTGQQIAAAIRNLGED